MTETLHATAVVFCGHGLLLRGPSGAGKSDLALRLIDAGGALISDDRVVCWVENGALIASPPEAIKGLLEIRGIGLRKMAFESESRISFAIDCVAQNAVKRLPENAYLSLHGVEVPLVKLYPFEASAVAKIRALLQTSPAHD